MVNRKNANNVLLTAQQYQQEKLLKCNERNNNNNNNNDNILFDNNVNGNRIILNTHLNNTAPENRVENRTDSNGDELQLEEERKRVEQYRKELKEVENNKEIMDWLLDHAKIMKPKNIRMINGSEEENKELIGMMVEQGTLIKLNEEEHPDSYAAFSHPSDVARVEKQTFICSEKEEDAGPTNNWQPPHLMLNLLNELLDGAMRGRTMYVITFCMAPVSSPFSLYAIQITDSPYVVVNMRIMTRLLPFSEMEKKRDGKDYTRCVHSVGAPLKAGEKDVEWPCNKTHKYIVHFPHLNKIYSYGSGYGGNALLGKKCLALRIASALGRQDGWLAEHMLILSITNPLGEKKYMAAAFPSACGKTNLAMLKPTIPGWKVETIGDDIAWIRPGKDGRLYAVNPENGFFGVAPGTSQRNNPIAMSTISSNTLFTNVALTEDRSVWWEGLSSPPPFPLTNWQGKKVDQINDHPSPFDQPPCGPHAHPNSRFTTPIKQCPIIDDAWENGDGVPLSAIIFGGRRKTTSPLVREAVDWNNGVFFGSIISSEQTAAAEGAVGSLRHDPFAMLPFCGYNMADYFAHWLSLPSLSPHSSSLFPKVFYVNWFLTSPDSSQFLWPGFGENGRVLKWIFERTEGKIGAEETPIGLIPKSFDFDLPPSVSPQNFDQLFKVNIDDWKHEVASISQFMSQFGDKLPLQIKLQIRNLSARLNKASS